MFTVKEATLTNEKLRQVVNEQKAVISDQSSRITQLQQDLTSTRSSLSELRAVHDSHDTENDQLISTLRHQLHAVSRCHVYMTFILNAWLSTACKLYLSVFSYIV